MDSRVPTRRLLRGAQVVTEAGSQLADILIADERIVAVGRDLDAADADDVEDLSGLVIAPGAIDLHVHFEEPGNTQREGFRTGTQAAAAGGITMVVEHPLSEPPTTSRARYRAKRDLVERSAYVDFGLWGGAVPGNTGEFDGMAAEGAPGFKAFLVGSEPEYPRLDDDDLVAAMTEAGRIGSIMVVHAEDHDIVEAETSRLRSSGRVDPLAWSESRPSRSEVVAVHRALDVARTTGSALHLVHLSVPDSVRAAMDARLHGVDVGIETCPHYLLLDTADLERLGPWAKCAPPLRSREEVEGMWALALAGSINFIASDHAPWEPSEKSAGESNIWGARNGFQSLQFMTVLGLDAWLQREGSLPDWVRLTSAAPARWLGLFPTKGDLGPGSDADLAVYSIGARRQVRASDLFNKHRWTPFDGMSTGVEVVGTMVRGRWVYRNGGIAEPPSGRFVPAGRHSGAESSPVAAAG